MRKDVTIAEYYGLSKSQVDEICDEYIDSELTNDEFKSFLQAIKSGETYENLSLEHPAWLADMEFDFQQAAAVAADEEAIEADAEEEDIEYRMSSYDIRDLTKKLESEDPCGGYVSRRTIYQNALKAGKITQNEYNNAAKFYGSIWNYTGD